LMLTLLPSVMTCRPNALVTLRRLGARAYRGAKRKGH
jgi:hypothetical protein